MKELSALGRDEVGRLVGLVFDLDDTLLDHGALREEAYRSLFRLREAGYLLIACTGRPAGWAEIVARQWPIDAAIAENGAIGFTRENGRVLRIDRCSPAERAERTRRIREAARAISERFSTFELADDNGARISDLTFDIGEFRHVAPPIVGEARDMAHALGMRTFVSSVHMHLTLETYDKASGTIDFLRREGVLPGGARREGAAEPRDPTAITVVFAYAGDSENDGPAFAAFKTTFGVANVRERAGQLSVPPRYVAHRERGLGFAEIATRLVELRALPISM